MKKTSLLFVLVLLLTLTTFASRHSRKSSLEISLWNNDRFSVVIDHQIYPANVRNFRIDNLQPGDHFIKIIKKTQRHNGFISQTVFRGRIHIKASSIVKARITRNRKFNIISIRPKHQIHHNSGHNSHHGHHSNGSHGVNSHGHSGVNSHSVIIGDAYIEEMSAFSFGSSISTLNHYIYTLPA